MYRETDLITERAQSGHQYVNLHAIRPSAAIRLGLYDRECGNAVLVLRSLSSARVGVVRFHKSEGHLKTCSLPRSHPPQNITPFIHLIVSCLNAMPEQIGQDLTMWPLSDGQNYDIKVQSSDGSSRTYRTLELLSKPSVANLRSKGSRVWKAVLLEHGQPVGAPVALKDVWVDPTLRPEGSAFEAVSRAAGAAELRTDRFLSVVAHGDVVLNDTTKSIDCTRSFTPLTPSSVGARTRDDILDSVTGEVIPKVHYRIVFAELGHPIDQETSPAVIFHALARTAQGESLISTYGLPCLTVFSGKALQAMHMAGWVHRNVSNSNILVEANNKIRLSDFEYSKPCGEGSEFRTVRSSKLVSFFTTLLTLRYICRVLRRLCLQKWTNKSTFS